ncbi:hypothetical protein GF324_00170 [bacterium]|nr:hypothetical protein [bacterium]
MFRKKNMLQRWSSGALLLVALIAFNACQKDDVIRPHVYSTSLDLDIRVSDKSRNIAALEGDHTGTVTVEPVEMEAGYDFDGYEDEIIIVDNTVLRPIEVPVEKPFMLTIRLNVEGLNLAGSIGPLYLEEDASSSHTLTLSEDVLMPLAVGNYWSGETYQTPEGGTPQFVGESTLSVASEVQFNDETWYRISSPNGEFFGRNAGGGYVMAQEVTGNESDYERYAYPASTGSHGIFEITSTTASVTVPAGQFAGCYIYRYDVGGGEYLERTYKPGIGMIREVIMSGGVENRWEVFDYFVATADTGGTNPTNDAWNRMDLGSAGTTINSVHGEDFDLDGDTDLIVTSLSDGIQYWSNNGGTWDQTTIDPDGAYAGSHVYVDWDGDGDVDIIAGRWAFANIAYYQNNGGTWSKQTLFPDLPFARDFDVIDMDGDNRQDLVVTWEEGNFKYVGVGWNDGTLEILGDRPFTSEWFTDLKAGNLDADAEIEIVTVDEEFNEIALWDFQGGFWNQIEIGSYVDWPVFLDLVDYDNDSDLDISYSLIGTDQFNWIVNTDTTWTEAAFNMPTTPNGARRKFADIDNDGDMDFTAYGRGNQTWVWGLNDGTGVYTWDALEVTVADLGDFYDLVNMDGDNDLDAVMGDGTDVIYLENGTDEVTRQGGFPASSMLMPAPHFPDHQ